MTAMAHVSADAAPACAARGCGVFFRGSFRAARAVCPLVFFATVSASFVGFATACSCSTASLIYSIKSMTCDFMSAVARHLQ
jgi:hypothetical protein